jgi:hypothetical protein
VDPAAGRLTAPTARYTALWPRYTAGGGADGGGRPRTELGELRTGVTGWSGVTGSHVWVLLGHLVDLGFMGLNGPTHDFFSFFTTSKALNK